MLHCPDLPAPGFKQHHSAFGLLDFKRAARCSKFASAEPILSGTLQQGGALGFQLCRAVPQVFSLSQAQLLGTVQHLRTLRPQAMEDVKVKKPANLISEVPPKLMKPPKPKTKYRCRRVLTCPVVIRALIVNSSGDCLKIDTLNPKP